jgi:hypothetical protein
MSYLTSTIRKMFFWNYARNTWQWDVLCALILVFIFLTPKSWFSGGERQPNMAHQSPSTETYVVGVEVVGTEEDRLKLRDRVRALSGRADAEVAAVRRVLDKEGKTLAFQVDIR